MLYLAFLLRSSIKVWYQKRKQTHINIFEIITEAAGGKMGLPISTEDLKTIAWKWTFKPYSGIAELFRENVQVLTIICQSLKSYQITFVYRKRILAQNTNLAWQIAYFYAETGQHTLGRARDSAHA